MAVRRCLCRRIQELSAAPGQHVALPVLARHCAHPRSSQPLQRGFSSSSSLSYPRQLPRRGAANEVPSGIESVKSAREEQNPSDGTSYKWIREVPREGQDGGAARRKAGQSDRPSFRQRLQQSSGKDALSVQTQVPWYLRDSAKSTGSMADAESLLGTGEEIITETQSITQEAPLDLPHNLAGLHRLLLEGSCSALVARPDETDESGNGIDSVTGRPPINFIHAKKFESDSWTDWIVVVQVRSSAGGAVSRVARDVGSYLRTARPPATTNDGNAIPTSLDDLLGPPQQLGDETGAETADEQTEGWDHDTNESETKRSWQPRKILSREAQDGMRTLHSHDPERWTRDALAEQFSLSKEAVRRILKSKWQPPSSVVVRQNRRAQEREEERRHAFRSERESRADPSDPSSIPWAAREAQEIALITRSIRAANGADGATAGDDAKVVLEGQEDAVRYDFGSDADLAAAIAEGKSGKQLQPVFYEGLISTPSAGEQNSRGNGPGTSRSAKDATVSRARSGIARGDGEWCLVDAGWVVVHVMSARARQKYDVESKYDASERESELLLE